MAKLSTKHDNQFSLSLQDLSKGLCLIAGAESIPDGYLAKMDNFEYGTVLNQPQVVPGVVSQYDVGAVVDTIFYDAVHSIWYCSVGTTLYSTNLTTKTSLGTLKGSARPVYCLYDDVVLVASGGTCLQKISSGTTLADVTGSPACHWVAQNNGRVEVFNLSTDAKQYSAIGDYTGWTNTPADISSAQSINIGYKDQSAIACSIKLATDSIVIKQSGSVYRVLSENNFSNVAVVPAAQKITAANHYSGLSLLNKAFFIGSEGFNSFSTVTDYGGVKVDDPSPGYMINGWYVNNMDANARIWHIPAKKQIWARTSNTKEVLIYHYSTGTWSKRQFIYAINDVHTVGTNTYIAYGNKIGKLSDLSDTDDGTDIVAVLESKKYIPKRKKYLMSYMNFATYNIIGGDYVLTVGNKVFVKHFAPPGEIADTDTDSADTDTDVVSENDYVIFRKRMRKRTPSVQVNLTVQTGRLAIKDFGLDLSEVGI